MGMQRERAICITYCQKLLTRILNISLQLSLDCNKKQINKINSSTSFCQMVQFMK